MAKTSWKQAISETTDVDRGKTIDPTPAVFQVKRAEAGTSKSGKEFLDLTATVLDGEYAGAEISNKIYYSPQSKVAVKIWWQNLAALGVDDAWIMEADPTLEQIAQSTIGVQFSGKITKEEFPKGRWTNRFDIYDYLGREGEEHDSSDAAGSTGLEEFEPEAENPDAADALPDTGPEKTPPLPEPVTEDQQQVLVTPDGSDADEDPWGSDDA